MKYYQLGTALEFFIACIYLFLQDSNETYLYVVYGVSLLNLIIMCIISAFLEFISIVDNQEFHSTFKPTNNEK
jgi:hypothetical protein